MEKQLLAITVPTTCRQAIADHERTQGDHHGHAHRHGRQRQCRACDQLPGHLRPRVFCIRRSQGTRVWAAPHVHPSHYATFRRHDMLDFPPDRSDGHWHMFCSFLAADRWFTAGRFAILVTRCVRFATGTSDILSNIGGAVVPTMLL